MFCIGFLKIFYYLCKNVVLMRDLFVVEINFVSLCRIFFWFVVFKIFWILRILIFKFIDNWDFRFFVVFFGSCFDFFYLICCIRKIMFGKSIKSF